ncbi:MAG: DNA recombination protein RmuC [Bacteroidetes bacterium]|nr:DNA recombination protein RmuC [Bacteroidota bacterium]
MENIILIILAILVVYLLLKLNNKENTNPNVQEQFLNLSNKVIEQMQSQTASVNTQIQSTQDQQQQFIQTVNKLVNESSKQVLGILEKQNTSLDSRLNSTNLVLNDLRQAQGRMEQAGEEVRTLAQNFVKFEDLLKAPKLRGGLGETLLEEILRQVLPRNSYETQFQFKDGTKVDSIIRLSNGMLPIDAKFPMENFRKYYSAQDETIRNQSYKLFITDVKKHITDISDKYIRPTENTFDFALMYIPAENIYYETIIKWENNSSTETITDYARKKRVVPVSPNTFYSHLQIIAMGFKGLEVESNAKIILQTLNQLKGDLDRFIDDYNVIGKHLQNAKSKYDEAAREIDRFKNTLDKPTQQSLLPE